MPPYASETREFGGRRQLGIAAGFLVLAVLVAALPAGAQQWISSGLRATVLWPFIVTQEAVTRTRARATETERLQARVDSLLAVVTNQATVVRENERLRSLASLGERLAGSYRAADVVRPGTSGSESMFLISLGSTHGVRENTPVIDHRGLVGVIREVGPATAIGMDWTHPEFRASAMTEGGGAFGLVEPSREAFREADRLVLNGTPYSADLRDGTLLVTSGLGGVYPRGIPIGRVRGVESEEAGWRRSYWIEPAVNPASVTHVLVRVRTPSLPLDPDQPVEAIRDIGPAWSPPSTDSAGPGDGPDTPGGRQ
jgi:rod shape-determining protein MreC